MQGGNRTHSRARRAIALGAAGLAVGGVLAWPAAAEQPSLTTERTITGDADADFSLLRPGPPWRRVVRSELGRPRSARNQLRRSLLYLTALDEIHYTDEESPARVEFLDADDSPFTSAWFPFEALRPFSIDRVFRTVNENVRSPVAQGDGSRARMALALTTGDNFDNQQRNEASAFVRLLEGGTLDPNSGVESNRPCPAGPVPPGEARRYTGVQDYDDYQRERSFYDPDVPVGRWSAFPRYRGLMDRAQRPFRAAGLDVPSYVSLGNHDRLVQGNQFANAPFERVAIGCQKTFGPVASPNARSSSTLNPNTLNPNLRNGVSASGAPGGRGMRPVPPDPRRAFVSSAELKGFFDTGRQADKHGFGYVDRDERIASRGAASYYSWRPRRGVRMISLNTASEGGLVGPSAEGNLDDPQFRWLRGELAQAQRARELVILFGHHPIGSLRSPVPDENAPPCGPDPARDPNPGCDLDPRASEPIRQGRDVEGLLKATPNVVAYVAGHTTVNRVTPFVRSGGGGFWQIESSSVSDWPNEARLVELMDNRDGTLSIFGTMLNQDTPVGVPASGTSASGFSARTLASIDRVLAFNDPQDDPEETVGPPESRNVELLLRDPRTAGGTTGTRGDDVLVGTEGDDVIRCGSGDDRVDGRGGDDTIYCGSGNDVVDGGSGDDRLYGGSGNDAIDGGSGDDRLYGESGNDAIDGGPGEDALFGGTGDDRLSGGPGRDRLEGGTGTDRTAQ